MRDEETLDEKVLMLIRSVAGAHAEKVSGCKLHKNIIQRIKQAHSAELGPSDASRLGMHMSDWIGDAAFLLALHWFPDGFSDEEIRDGVSTFLGHAPNHIRAACGITGTYVWESFPDEDVSVWEDAP